MTTTHEEGQLAKSIKGIPPTVKVGGGNWSQEEIKAMTPRQVTQAEYDLQVQKDKIKNEELAKEAQKLMKLVENYKNNVKTFRIYDPITKTYSPPNK